VERCSWRWAIEPSNATGRQITGIGDACNRLWKAAVRIVPSGFLIQTLLIVWYARSGCDEADVTTRRLLCPWYQAKTEPSAADMLARLRGSSSSPISGHQARSQPLDLFEGNAWTCGTTAA
jgi:hypothetical protein